MIISDQTTNCTRKPRLMRLVGIVCVVINRDSDGQPLVAPPRRKGGWINGGRAVRGKGWKQADRQDEKEKGIYFARAI